jgi:type I restriction enzyme S subunit
MSEWQETTLEIIAEPVKEGWKPDKNDIKPYIGLEHIEQEKLRLNSVGSSDQVISNKFAFESGDILFGKLRPYFRKVVRTNFSGVCSTDIWVMRAKQGFEQSWLLYFMADWDFINLANGGEGGSRMPRADWNFLKSTVWNVPPLPEQQAIAEVLSSLDDKIDLLHRQNQTLEALAETLFRQWFIEEADPEWEEKPLAYFAENRREGLKPSELVTEIPYVGLEHITPKSLTLNHFGSSKDVTSQKFRFSENDILFGKLRPYFHKVCLSPLDGCCSTDILVIRPKKPEWLGFCVFAFFQKSVIDFVDGGSEGTRMPRTSWDVLSTYKITIPNDEKVVQFHEAVMPSIEKMKQNRMQIQSLEKTRDELLPKLMSGEVRVGGDRIAPQTNHGTIQIGRMQSAPTNDDHNGTMQSAPTNDDDNGRMPPNGTEKT